MCLVTISTSPFSVLEFVPPDLDVNEGNRFRSEKEKEWIQRLDTIQPKGPETSECNIARSNIRSLTLTLTKNSNNKMANERISSKT